MQGVLRRELAELTHELPVPSECKLRVEAVLERREDQLVEPTRGHLRERLMLEVGKRRAAPKRECLTLQLERGLTLATVERLTRLLGQPLESPQVEVLACDVEHVARCPSLEADLVAERLAELRDLAVHLRGRGHGGTARVELVREAVDRDDPVRVQEQDRERRPLLRPAKTDLAALVADLERAQDPELEQPGRGPYPFDTGSGPHRTTIGPFGKSRKEQ